MLKKLYGKKLLVFFSKYDELFHQSESTRQYSIEFNFIHIKEINESLRTSRILQ